MPYNKLETEGRFLAVVTQAAATESKNGCLQIAVMYYIDSMHKDGEWQQVNGEYEITGWHFLTKNDGTLNEVQIKQLAESFRIDTSGGMPAICNPESYLKKSVQITVKRDTYNGQTSYKVSWVSPADADPNGGGLQPANIDKFAHLNSQLRALNIAVKPDEPVQAKQADDFPY
jgi:hypothetical protein